MKRIISAILSAAILLTATLALTSCSSRNDGFEFSAYYVGNLYDLDPAKDYTNDDAVEVFNLIYQPLFNLGADGSILPGLVETYSYDPYSRILALTFRDTCWSNKDPVVGNDLLYAWHRILQTDTASRAAALLYDVENAYYCKIDQGPNGEHVSLEDVGLAVDGKDPKTVYITLVEGADVAAFVRNLTNIALTPIRENTVNSAKTETGGNYWANSMASIATNGPFKIKTWNHLLGTFTLQRNENYFYAKGDEDRDVTQYVYPAAFESQWAALTQDSLSHRRNESLAKDEAAAKLAAYNSFMDNAFKDTVFFLGDAPLDKRAELKDRALVYDSHSTYSYVFNLRNPQNELVKNKELRVAISQLLNRAAIVEKTVFGKAAQGLISDATYYAGLAGIKYASQRPQNLLLEDVTAAKATIRSITGNVKPTLTLVIRDSEEEVAIANLVKSQLADVITLNIVAVSAVYPTEDLVTDGAIFAPKENMSGMYDAVVMAYTVNKDGGLYYYAYDDVTRSNPLQYDMIAMDYQMLSTDAFVALASFSSSYSGNGLVFDADNTPSVALSTSGYYSEAYDAKIAEAYAKKNLLERAPLLYEAEEMLLADMPIIPIMSNQSFACINPALSGVTVNGYGHFGFMHAFIENFWTIPERPAEEN